jgi:hypothetical protein
LEEYDDDGRGILFFNELLLLIKKDNIIIKEIKRERTKTIEITFWRLNFSFMY